MVTAPLPASSVRDGFVGAIGGTPLLRLPRLSAATGCTILGKAEFLSPGGSVKDRAALFLVEAAERAGRLGGASGVTTIVEGTAGNTGIGLTLVARARGYRSEIVIPRTQSEEKLSLLRALGATLHLVDAVPFADERNYYHVARRLAAERGWFWADQFENPANAEAHYRTTGPELLADAPGLSGFVTSAGTGGTLGGVSAYLAEAAPAVERWLIDCEGSSLANYVATGSLDAAGSSILEGIGIRRITSNFARGKLSGAFRGTDREAVAMAHYLLAHEGLFLGGSAALNCVGAVKLARRLGPGATIATILCDGGQRYASRLFDEAWLRERGLPTEAPADLTFVA